MVSWRGVVLFGTGNFPWIGLKLGMWADQRGEKGCGQRREEWCRQWRQQGEERRDAEGIGVEDGQGQGGGTWEQEGVETGSGGGGGGGRGSGCGSGRVEWEGCGERWVELNPLERNGTM